jgi:UDP-3-O-[3-hydroxymyristoyl] glucosamine N-acyltransferase
MNHKQTTVGELAVLVDGHVVGDSSTRIYGISSIEDAQTGDVTFAENARLLTSAARSEASAVIAPQNGPLIGKPLIQVKNPRFAFADRADRPRRGLGPKCVGACERGDRRECAAWRK